MFGAPLILYIDISLGELKGKNAVVPLCGGNIDTTTLGRVLDRSLAGDDRLCRFVATISDRPGGIARLTDLLHQHGASIKDVMHERAWLHSSVDQVQVKVHDRRPRPPGTTSWTDTR